MVNNNYYKKIHICLGFKGDNIMNQTNTLEIKSNGETKISTADIVISAMFIALTFVATAFINVRLPIMANGGLIHLGNVPLFVCASIYGKRKGAIAGAFGMAMFDVTSGWTLWAPFTFIIVGMIGYAFGLINEKKITIATITLAVVVAEVIKVVGYYIAEGVIYGNWVAPVASIPGNVIQIAVAGIIAFPIIITLKKILKKQ